MKAVVSLSDYARNKKKGMSIASSLSQARKELVEHNRHYIKTVIQVIMLCGFQELAFRGHREDGESSNRGNFLELMTFASKHDSVVRDRLRDGPWNAMYTSHSIQNELIHIVAEKTRGIICDGVKNAGPFSIMADETKDYSKQEQLCLVVRYVDSAGNVKRALSVICSSHQP